MKLHDIIEKDINETFEQRRQKLLYRNQLCYTQKDMDLAITKTKEEIINNFPFDDRPTYGGLINFASNGVKDDITGFEYGFRLGWQTCWYELKDLLTKLK